MKKNILFLTALLCTYVCFSQPSATNFYQTLVRDVEQAKGNLTVDFNGGTWRTNYNQVALDWTIDEGTYALVNFDYDSRVMKDMTVTFTPAIHLSITTKKECTSISLTTLHFVNGRLKSNDAKPYGRGCNNVQTWDVLQNFEIDEQSTTSALFTGFIFPAMRDALILNPVTKYFVPTEKKMVRKVAFQRQGANQPGLYVLLAQNATLDFSKSGAGGYSNSVTTMNPSSFEFDNVSYLVEKQQVRGKLYNLNLIVANGSFESSDCGFLLTNNSSLKLNNIEFEKNPATDYVHISGGTFEGRLGNGSMMNLSRGSGAAPNTIVFGDNTVVSLKNFSVTMDPDKTEVNLGNGSILDISILSARVGFGTDGYINWGNGNIKLKLQTAIFGTKAPIVYAEVLNLNVRLSSGVVPLNETGYGINLSGGSLIGTGLMIKSDVSPIITGHLTQCNFEVGDNSEYGIPKGIYLKTNRNGTLNSTDITIKEGKKYPSGIFQAQLPFRKFGSTSQREFTLLDGVFESTIETTESDEIHGTNTDLKGTMKVDVAFQPTTGTALLALHIDDAKFDYANNKATMQGFIEGKGSLHLSAPVTTLPRFNVPSGDNDVEKVVIFPINLRVYINDDMFSIPRKDFSFDGSIIKAQLILSTTINVDIAGGNGQHKNRFNLSEGFDGGPDDLKGFQELAVADYDGPLMLNCTVHAYLRPVTRKFETTVQVDYNGTAPAFSLTNFKLDHHLKEHEDFERDGCEVKGLLTVFGAVFGGLGGAVIGNVFGNTFDEKLTGIMADRANGKIDDFINTWTVQH